MPADADDADETWLVSPSRAAAAAIEQRRKGFEAYAGELARNSIVGPRHPCIAYACPCCKCRTLSERGGFSICPVCFWEDDGQDEHDAERIRSGPNGDLSLAQARLNFAQYGACDKRHIPDVRRPRPEELA